MVALLLLGGPVVAQQTPVAERLTWTQGDSWTWSDPALHQLKYTVLAVTHDYYTVEVIAGSDRSVVTVDPDLHPKDNIIVQFQWPLRQGATWKRTLTGVAPDGPGEWEITSTVETNETVVTPAGPFEAFRIKANHCTTKNRMCGDLLTWYAPSAKFYMKVSWGSGGYWPPPFAGNSRALTSYQVHLP